MNYISKNELEDCARLAKEFKRLYDGDVIIGVYAGTTYPHLPEVQMTARQYVESFGQTGRWLVAKEADYYRKETIFEGVVFFSLTDEEDYEYEKVQEDR